MPDITIPHIAFTWYVIIGALVTFAIGSLASLVFRSNPAAMPSPSQPLSSPSPAAIAAARAGTRRRTHCPTSPLSPRS